MHNDSLFADIAGADVQGRGVRIDEDGEFIVQIREEKTQISRRGQGTLWVVLFEIISGGTEKNPNGSVRSWAAKPQARPQTDKGAVKSHILASLGLDPNKAKDVELTEQNVRDVVGPAQKLYGLRVGLQTEMIVTQGTKMPFCVHIWRPVKEGEIVRGDTTPVPASAGWEPHPDVDGWEWCPATNEVRKVQ